MIILAHRGLWETPAERNSRIAFERAFSAGFGVELDVRDLAGELVVSHDPPLPGALRLYEVLELYQRAGAPGRLAINIKADGLAHAIDEQLSKSGLQAHSFVFDMSVPDARSYLALRVPVFTRFSEYEPQPAFYEAAHGVWVDSFHGPRASATRALADLRRGKSAALVSPELHRMPHGEAWNAWLEELGSVMTEGLEGLMICTDFPVAASKTFARLGAK